MNADIDKRAEVSDVSDRPFQNHHPQQVVHGFDAIGELRVLNSGRGRGPGFSSSDDSSRVGTAEFIVGKNQRP